MPRHPRHDISAEEVQQRLQISSQGSSSGVGGRLGGDAAWRLVTPGFIEDSVRSGRLALCSQHRVDFQSCAGRTLAPQQGNVVDREPQHQQHGARETLHLASEPTEILQRPSWDGGMRVGAPCDTRHEPRGRVVVLPRGAQRRSGAARCF